MKLWKFLKKRMQSYGSSVAFHDSLTYAELIKQAEMRASQISTKGELIVVSNEDKEQQAIDILAVIASGNTAVPLAADYGAVYVKEIKRNLKDKHAGRNVPLVLFTSGSSGRPKGVMLTDYNIIQNLLGISDYYNVGTAQNMLILRPLAHSSSVVGELFFALYNGIKLDFYKESFIPKRVLAYMHANKTGAVGMTPTMAKLMSALGKQNEYPRIISLSGELLSDEDAITISKAFPCASIYNAYGLTENAPRVMALMPDYFSLKPGSVGKPIRKTKVKIVGDELYIKSHSIMKGYLGDKAYTREKIKRGWLKTGDTAYCDADGFYYISGRTDDMIIRCGINIYPAEVEKLIKKDKRIKEAFCYCINDKFVGKTFCAEIVPADGCTISESEIRQIALKNLPPYIPLSKIKIVEQPSITVGGKLKKGRS